MRNRRLQHGIVVVEMAIIVPVFLMLMLAVAELGRVCYQYNTLTKAVHDGARYLSAHALNGAGVLDLNDSDFEDAADVAANLIVYGSPAAGDEPLLPGLELDDVEVTSADDVSGAHVVVTVSYTYQPLISALPTYGWGEAIGTLTASLAMVAM